MRDWSWYILKAAKLAQLRDRVPGIIVATLMLLTLGSLFRLVTKGNNSRRPRLIQVCAIVAAVSVVSTIGWYVLSKAWRPIPSYTGIEASGPFISGLFGIVALVVIASSKKLGYIIMGLPVCSLSTLGVYAVPNVHYSAYASLAQVLRGPGKVQAFGEAGRLAPIADIYRPGDNESVKQTSLEQRWRLRQAENIDTDSGVLVQVDIPATNLSPRPSIVYLPPAYFTRPRPLLSVLVLMPGQPSTPKDWLANDDLKSIMDRFVKQHNELAPIMAIANQLSSSSRNPLCSDTENGAAVTYLEHDVLAWLEEHFQIGARPQLWAVGKLSNRDTCVTQVLSHRGGPCRTVLDMSGEEFPSLHNLETTIGKGFGGDKIAFEGNNPLSIFSSGEDFIGYSAFCSISDKEPRGVIEGLQKVCRAGHSRGMDAQERTYSGTYERKVWERSLDDELPRLAVRMNPIRMPSHQIARLLNMFPSTSLRVGCLFRSTSK